MYNIIFYLTIFFGGGVFGWCMFLRFNFILGWFLVCGVSVKLMSSHKVTFVLL